MSTKTNGSSAGRSGVLHGSLYETDYFTELYGMNNRSIVGIGINQIWATPYMPITTRTVDRIAFTVQGTAGASVLAGIYADNGLTPVGGARLVVSASTALIATKPNFITIGNTQLTGGVLYYIALNFSAAATIFQQALNASQFTIPVTEPNNWNNNTGVYALPDPFPAGAAIYADGIPATWLRVASVP